MFSGGWRFRRCWAWIGSRAAWLLFWRCSCGRRTLGGSCSSCCSSSGGSGGGCGSCSGGSGGRCRSGRSGRVGRIRVRSRWSRSGRAWGGCRERRVNQIHALTSDYIAA